MSVEEPDAMFQDLPCPVVGHWTWNSGEGGSARRVGGDYPLGSTRGPAVILSFHQGGMCVPRPFQRALRGLVASTVAVGLAVLGAVPALASASSVSGVNVTVTPATAGSAAQYDVGFTATSGLTVGQAVYLTAASGTVFSSVYSEYRLNGSVPSAVYGGGSDAITLLVPSGLRLSPGGTVSTVVYNTYNPSTAGAYNFDVSTSADPTVVASPYMITAGAPAAITETLTPTSVGPGGSVTVSGAVYDAHGNPVSAATVDIAVNGGTPLTATTASNGAYSATATAPSTPGTATVSATVSGQPSVTKSVTLTVITVSPPPPPTTGFAPPPPVTSAVPTVTGINPSVGPNAGGTPVTITGTNLVSPLQVHFGTAEASSVTVESSSQIEAISPPGSGTVAVTVTDASGTSGVTAADHFTYTPTTAVFSDVSSGFWAYSYIELLASKGIVNGFPNGTFQPNAEVTRAQFVKMLVLTLGLQPGTGATTFTDVPSTAWYAPYVSAAVQDGLVAGLTPTTFGPNQPLTREQMAVLLARALKLSQTTTLQFTDDAQIAPYALTAVEEAVAAGYFNGFPNGTFQPAGTATRAQAAKILAMVLNASSTVGSS